MKKALKKPHKYDPVLSVYTPSTHFGSMSEKYPKEIEAYIEKNPSKLLADKKKKSKKRKSEADAGAQDGATRLWRSFDSPRRSSVSRPSAPCARCFNHRGLVDPGEAVGLLAAQGVGEPSTR